MYYFKTYANGIVYIFSVLKKTICTYLVAIIFIILIVIIVFT